MKLLTESIEHELSNAFEVKNREALHHYALLMAENLVARDEYTAETGTLHADIREILTEMRTRFDANDRKFELLHEVMNARFNANDKRFDDINKRFDDMNKRFDQMVRLTGLGITALALLITVFNFL